MERMVSEVERWGTVPEVEAPPPPPLRFGCEPDKPAAMTFARSGFTGSTSGSIWGSEVDMGSSASSSRTPGIAIASVASGGGGGGGGGSTSGGRCDDGELLEDALLDALCASVSPDCK